MITPALTAHSTDQLQHELLCRSIHRNHTELARLTVQLATMERRQRARYDELQRLETRLLAAQRKAAETSNT